MSVLRLAILVSLLGCCLGYVIVKRPAEYNSYPRKGYSYQYKYAYKPKNYQSYSYKTYDYKPYDYKPYDYKPYDYKPYDYTSYDYKPYDYKSYDYKPYDYEAYDYKTYDYQPQYYQSDDYQNRYYGNYYYYYPYSYEHSEPHKYDHHKQHLPYDEAQKLLQLYRLIRVIDLFRSPPPKKQTSLDRLVQQLTNATLQEQIAKLLYHVEGYEEVAQLERGNPEKGQTLFVDDPGQLLHAIQRDLNALDLDDHEHMEHHYDHSYYSSYYGHKQYKYTGLPKKLRGELRQLRDQANALTVEQIRREKKHGAKAQAKEDLVTDLLGNLVGEGEAKELMEEFNENYDVNVKDGDALSLDDVDKYVVVIDEEEPKSGDHQLNKEDEEALDELAAALEHYLEEQKINKGFPAKNKSDEVHSIPIPDTTTSTTTTTTTPVPTTTTETVKDSWLASLIGKGTLLPGQRPVDVSQPTVLVEPMKPDQGEPNAWVHEDNAEKDKLDFDIDQRFQTPTTTAQPNPATHSVPLWLTENQEQQQVEAKEGELDLKDSKETEPAEELPEHKQEPEEAADNTTEEATTTEASATTTEEVTEAAADRELPVDEVEQEANGPDRIDLLADLTAHKVKDSTPEPMPVDDQTESLDESSTPEPAAEEPTSESALNAYEVHTESDPVESREGQPALPSTVESKPDARRFIKEEVMKVLSLLEEANGFTELKNHITDEDVNKLVDELQDVEVGIRWAEMISALQKVVMEKQPEDGARIVDVLEHWKEGEEGQLDDGYFDRTYGGGEDAESRELVDGEETELKSNQGEEEILESADKTASDQSEITSEQFPIADDADEQINNEKEETEDDRNPRLIDVNEAQDATPNPTEDESTSSEISPQDEETTEKLEETTLEPFPADEA